MPFENQRQQQEIQPAPQSQLSARASEYQTYSHCEVPLRGANEILVAQGTLTNLQILADTSSSTKVESVSGASAVGYGTTKLSPNFYASGIVLNSDQDLRTTQEKMSDFVEAAAHRLTDSGSIQEYMTSEREKFQGIGEGLKIAKEKTKASAVAGWNAVADGSVANFLAKPNALNNPLFDAAGGAIARAMEDPNATNKILTQLGRAVGEASEQYSRLPSHEKGKVIGETMFGCVNPEGGTEAAEAALKIADKVATNVDAHVMNVVEKSVQAIEKMKSASPEFVEQSREMLYDYIRRNQLTGPQLDYAGVPKGHFDPVATSSAKNDSFYAMSKHEGQDGVLNSEANAERNSLHTPTELVEGVNYCVEPKTGRLQRVDLGKLREPYEWTVLNERFDANCVRQSAEGTCMSACGEMVSNGRLTEAELLPHLGIPGNIETLPTLLGPEWTSKPGPKTLLEMERGGSWVAQFYDGEFRPGSKFRHVNLDTKEPHIVVVDGITADLKRMKIRDPLEGTSYEMTIPDFKRAWSGLAAYRRAE